MTGRPSSFNQEQADLICEMISGGMSLRAICDVDGWPDRTTVFRWLRDVAEFRIQYARAREDQAHAFGDDCVWISDNDPDPQTAKVRIDARKWYASKLLPKVYGDAISLKHGDPDGKPLAAIINVTIGGKKPDDAA